MPRPCARCGASPTRNAAVAGAVWLEIAERELAARRPRESAEAALKGLDVAQPRTLKEQLLTVRAQALAAVGDNDGAFDAHRQVLALATSSATLGEQLFRLAQVSRDLGKPAEAVRALRTALEQFPSASTTPDALRLLDELDAARELDPYILGRARYFAADYRNAVRAFDQYLQADANGPDAPSARLYRALASLSPGNEPSALRELDRIADDPDQETEIAAQALLEAGQALEGLSRIAAGRSSLSTPHRSLPTPRRGGDGRLSTGSGALRARSRRRSVRRLGRIAHPPRRSQSRRRRPGPVLARQSPATPRSRF